MPRRVRVRLVRLFISVTIGKESSNKQKLCVEYNKWRVLQTGTLWL